MNKFNIRLYKDIIRIEYDNCIDQFCYIHAKKNCITRYINNSTFGIILNRYYKEYEK